MLKPKQMLLQNLFSDINSKRQLLEVVFFCFSLLILAVVFVLRTNIFCEE